MSSDRRIFISLKSEIDLISQIFSEASDFFLTLIWLGEMETSDNRYETLKYDG